MPTMKPYPVSDTSPLPEKMFSETFRWITNDVVKDLVIFHAFEVSDSCTIDFVMLDKTYLSVICLEVVSRPAEKAPIEISKDAMDALRKKFSSHFGATSRLALGHAVVFPNETKYETDKLPDHLKRTFSEDIDLQGLTLCTGSLITCDDPLDPSKLGETLEEYARDDLYPTLTATKIKNARDWEKGQLEWSELRNNFESQYSTGATTMTTTTIFSDNLETLNRELLRLTTEQFMSLERVGNKHNSRCVIDGAAGTGKTVLAKELANRRIKLEETVALMCSNTNLSRYFEKWAEKISNNAGDKGKIIAGTPLTLPLSVFGNNGDFKEKYNKELDKSPKLREKLGTLRLGTIDDGWHHFLENIINDLQETGLSGYFDYLIVDEAQNLCDPVFLNLMDVLLKNGLTDGRWAMFGDFKNQDLVTLDRNIQWDDVLNGFNNSQLKGKWSYDELIISCRNTYEIADMVFGLSRPENSEKALIQPLSMPGVHGPDVQIEYFKTQDKLENKLEKLISTWKSKGLKSRQIILLSSGASDEFGTSASSNYGGWNLRNISEVPLENSQSEILRYSDVYDFQGLESDLVILVMPVTDDQAVLMGNVIIEQEKHLNRVLYTGMSRAKTMLIILAHEGYEETIDRRMKTWIEKKEREKRR